MLQQHAADHHRRRPQAGLTSLCCDLMTYLETQVDMTKMASASYHLLDEDTLGIMEPVSPVGQVLWHGGRFPIRAVSLHDALRDQHSRSRDEDFDGFVLGTSHRHRRGKVDLQPQACVLCRERLPAVSRGYRFQLGQVSTFANTCRRTGRNHDGNGRARVSGGDPSKICRLSAEDG